MLLMQPASGEESLLFPETEGLDALPEQSGLAVQLFAGRGAFLGGCRIILGYSGDLDDLRLDLIYRICLGLQCH